MLFKLLSSFPFVTDSHLGLPGFLLWSQVHFLTLCAPRTAGRSPGICPSVSSPLAPSPHQIPLWEPLSPPGVPQPQSPSWPPSSPGACCWGSLQQWLLVCRNRNLRAGKGGAQGAPGKDGVSMSFAQRPPQATRTAVDRASACWCLGGLGMRQPRDGYCASEGPESTPPWSASLLTHTPGLRIQASTGSLLTWTLFPWGRISGILPKS